LSRLIVSVTNDLSTDQRINKICETLDALGYDIVLIGRKLENSLPINRKYRTIRMQLLFKRGFFFYAEFNIRLFFRLLFLKKDILLSNDLDTLLPNFLISKIFFKKLVYDSHELFTEVPELVEREGVRKVWLNLEKIIFPKLKNVYTVNNSIANYYSKKYDVSVRVVRNISVKQKNGLIDSELSNKIKGGKKMLIIIGTGINKDRGAEEAVEMMQYVEDAVLYIIGGGDVFKKLKTMTIKLNLQDKITLLDKMGYSELMEYTKIADLGLSLDKGSNLNYEYSLPNKVFDYIQCNTPILATNRKEVATLINKNNIGYITTTLNPETLAHQVNSIFKNRELYNRIKSNLKVTAEKYCWENESEKLKEIYSNLK
jgi:glycosyltransferase involved in cell wall biosynthesis